MFNDIFDLVAFCQSNYEERKYIFRGQKQNWPLQSSIFRFKDDAERKEHWQRTLKFCEWMLNNSFLKPYHEQKFHDEPQEKLLAIAQHYGYPTDLVDFTWDVRVAAYFATSGRIDESKPGVIWVIEKEILEQIYESLKVPGLTIFEINGLWRLENQKGLFIRDYGGQLPLIIGGEHLADMQIKGFKFNQKIFLITPIPLIFKQIKGTKFEDSEINDSYIYPEPNDLEREIQRFVYYDRTSEFLKSELYKNLDSKGYVHKIERRPIRFEVEGITFQNGWTDAETKKWAIASELRYCDFPKISESEHYQIKITDFYPATSHLCNPTPYLNLIKKYRKRYLKDKIIPKIKVALYHSVFEMILQNLQEEFTSMVENTFYELISSIGLLPYSDNNVADSMATTFSYLFHFATKIEFQDKSLENKFTKAVFGEPAIELGFSDSAGVSSYARVPAGYLEKFKSITKIREKFNEYYKDNWEELFGYKKEKFRLESNIQVFQLMHDLKKIISFDEAIKLWAAVVVPYQILYRPEFARILNPYYVQRIGYA